MKNILLYDENTSIDINIKATNEAERFTSEQIQCILKYYLYDKLSMATIAKQFECSYNLIKKILEQNNIKIRSNRLHRDSDYFENIDSRAKAYWLGVMYSDGCVCKRANGSYSISLEMIDKEHIEKFRSALGAVSHKILTVYHKNFANAKPSFAIYMYDKKMANDLIKLGCVPKKSLSLSSIPKIPQEFMYDFIRGFVDGDGCICYNKSYDSYVFKLTGASPLLLKDIMGALEIDRLTLNQCTETSYQVTDGKRNDIYRILTKLYEHSTEETRLNRKYKKYQEFLQWYSQKKEEKE